MSPSWTCLCDGDEQRAYGDQGRSHLVLLTQHSETVVESDDDDFARRGQDAPVVRVPGSPAVGFPVDEDDDGISGPLTARAGSKGVCNS